MPFRIDKNPEKVGKLAVGAVSTPADGDAAIEGTLTAAALNGTLGATTPATVAATTVNASGRITATGGFTSSTSVPTVIAATANFDYNSGIAGGRAFVWGPNVSTVGKFDIKLAASDNTLGVDHRFSSTGLAVTGAVTATTGISFPNQTESTTGTPAASSVLSHYETGSWTPLLTPGAGAFDTLTYTINQGRYIRTGNLVWCGFQISVNAFTIGTGASYVKLTGFPFPRGVAEDQYGSGSVTGYAGWTTAAPLTLPRLNAGDCILRYQNSAIATANLPPANITAGCVMNGYMTFSV